MSTIAALALVDPANFATQADGSATTSNNRYSLTAPSTASSPITVTAPGGASVTWLPTELVFRDAAGNFDYIVGSSPSSVSVRNAQATYSRTFPQADDIFAALADRLKHWIVVSQPPRDPSSSLGTGIMFGVSGTLTGFDTPAGMYDVIGTDKFVLPRPTASDLAGNTIEGQYQVLDTTDANGNPAKQVFMWFDWSWFADGLYPVTIDPTVVVSSAYDTSGNGGRHIVRLSDNSIVAVAYNSGNETHYFYRSTDNGQTWTQIATVVSNTYLGSNVALASINTIVYAIMGTNSSGGGVAYWAFDATAPTSTTNPNSLEGSNSGGTSGVSLAVDSSGALHAAYAVKNATYPNSFNIRYSKGTTSGTTVTWSTPVFPTQAVNTANINETNPCIVVNSSSNPVIIYQYDDTANTPNVHRILSVTYSGTTWNAYTIVYDGGTYAQQDPCAAIDSNGSIHVVWQGTSATYSPLNVFYAKSTTGGGSWTSTPNLTTNTTHGASTPSLVVNESNNDLYILYSDIDTTINASYTQIRELKYTSGTWQGPTTLTNNTTGAALNPQTIWSEFNENSSDALRYVYQDNQASAVEYSSITFNNPPNAPTLAPHSNFDAAVAQTLTWTFSDPDAGNTQSAYQLQIVDVGSNTTVLDTGKVASTVSSYSLSANALTNGHNYQWRVATWDNNNAGGPYSAYSTFSCAGTPTVTITTPAPNGTIAASSLTVQFSYSDPASNAQQSYQVQLLDSGDATVLNDSGVINGTNNQYTIPYTLANNTTYHVKARATNAENITSAWADNTFSTSFTPPAQPTTTPSPDNANARISVVINNPPPGTGQPAVAYNDLYRRPNGTSAWQRIATQLPNNATYYDYAVASGVGYDYKITAVGNNSTSTDSTIVSNQSVGQLSGLWIHEVGNPSGTILNFKYMDNSNSSNGTTPNSTSLKHNATSIQYAGRTLPVVEFGEAYSWTLTKGKVTMIDSDNTWWKLEQMIRIDKPTFCFRDGRGRLIFGNVLDYNAIDMVGGTQVDLNLVQTSYSMTV